MTRSCPSQYGCEPWSERVPGRAVDAGVQAEFAVELVPEDGEERVLVRGVHRPEEERVDKLRRAQPALEEDHDPVRVDVVAAVDGAFVAEMIRERLLPGIWLM